VSISSTAVATANQSAPPTFQSPEAAEFDLMQRQAKLFANSPLVPAHISDGGSQKGLANCYIALVLAKQMGENPLVVMQNIYIVHGRAGWAATYMIAKANASGVFKGVIRFKYSGEGQKRAATAYATIADTGETVEYTVSMEMATAEGWTKNSKYKTLPDLMLSYRAATLLVRLYCPHVMLGYQTREELIDTTDGTTAEPPKTLSLREVVPDVDAEVVDAYGEVTTTNGKLFDDPAATPKDLASTVGK
jgi:hypothetical protein